MAEPSIAMIPSGYKAEKIYSVLPTNGNADLDFSRNSKSTRINEQGLIEEMAVNVPLLDYSDGTCPSLKLQPQSTNLITYSESFGNSYWTKSGASIEGDASTAGVDLLSGWDFTSGWATSNSVVNDLNTFTTSSVNGSVRKGYLTIDTFYLLNTNSSSDIGQVEIYSRNLDGSTSLISVGSGVFYFISNGTELLVRNTLSGATTDITTLEVKEVQGFSAPSVDSPLGAFKLVEGTSNGQHKLQKANLTVSATSNTVSYFIKKAERNKVLVEFGGGGGGTAGFDLSLGAIISESGVTAKIELISSDWYRCSVTFTTIATSVYTSVYTLNDSNSNSYQGDGTSGVYIFASQLEESSFATSYIKTEGSTQTRLADTASKSGLENEINSEEGVLYIESNLLETDSFKTMARLTDTDTGTSNGLWIYGRSDNKFQGALRVGGVDQINLISSVYPPNQFYKIALKWKINDFALWVNGIEVDTDLNGSSFSQNILQSLGFKLGSNTNPFKGNCKDLRVYKIALTDAQLTTLTTI